MTLYEILSVEPKAEQEEIKRAYRKLAQMHHPDKGGDKDKFQEIQNAYEVLSDDERRKFYDETGETGKAPSVIDAAVSELCQLFKATVSSSFDAVYSDLFKQMRNTIKNRLAEMDSAKLMCERAIVKNDKIVKRIKTNAAQNMFAGLAEADSNEKRGQIRQLEHVSKVHNKMLELLTPYSYEFDEQDGKGKVDAFSMFDIRRPV